ncbi:MAG: hypothetical protein Q7T17_04015 [Microbacterium sp.]|uniref:hypothetical protein n=1 Tax=Microbacterium sp. TaxID=51671 RepID=UPI0027276D28|nr:hypothetical protein [Microbacterium sp.]MDO8382124.1 hypothetical protein [Microbacterium sp.]
MTRTNRLANRIILAVIGLIALALAAVVALPFAPMLGFTIPWEDLGLAVPDATLPPVVWTVAGAAFVVVLFAITWIVTRGRGRTSTALSIEGATIDASVVQSVLRERLANAPDVVVVSASAHRRRGGPVVLVRVQARPGPDLAALQTAIRGAIDRLDEVIGTRIPLVVHLTSGVRSSIARPRTTH